jgi:hypothetical protein
VLAASALAVVAATAAFGTAAAMPAAIVSPPPRLSCDHAKGPFHVSGVRVVGANGRVYIPYGTTAFGLAVAGYKSQVASLDSQIRGAAAWWCVNTVRLQVAQSNLVGSTASKGFLSAVKSAVSLAESLGLVVVISDQTEEVGLQPGPTSATAAFWKDLIKVYGRDGQVVFDLFNEPRVKTGGTTATWRLWRDGGTYHSTAYLGMQQLVTDVRKDGARNLLWVEGPFTATTLDKVSSYRITGGGPLMYDIHHPAGAHDEASWSADFGYLVTRHIAPVVDGEWTNYAAARGECWPEAPTQVPAYLRYLQHLGVGMTVWTLEKGVMIETASLWDPTRFRSTWACQNGLDQGAGAQVMHWYVARNKA